MTQSYRQSISSKVALRFRSDSDYNESAELEEQRHFVAKCVLSTEAPLRRIHGAWEGI